MTRYFKMVFSKQDPEESERLVIRYRLRNMPKYKMDQFDLETVILERDLLDFKDLMYLESCYEITKHDYDNNGLEIRIC